MSSLPAIYFRQNGPLTTKLVAVKRLKSNFFTFSFAIGLIILKFAGNKDVQKVLDEFEFWPDPTNYFGVSCP